MSAGGTDFDGKARTWDADPAKVARARRVAEAIARHLGALPGLAILEYGAGTGLLGFALAERGASVTLADSSSEMLAVASEKIAASGTRGLTALHLDLTAGPPPAARYDVVCSLMVLHHVADTDDVLRKLRTLLVPGGVLFVADLDREDGSFHGEGFTGHNGFDRADLGRRLSRAGFASPTFETVAEVVREGAAGKRVYPIFLAVART